MKKLSIFFTVVCCALLIIIGGYEPVSAGTNADTVTDIDGNVYHTVKIGNQVWTLENLRTTRFNDGTPIPLVTDKDKWFMVMAPAYCWYENDFKNKDKYGALYNWFAVDTKKLVPKGWHIPSEAEWTILENYLIANGYNWDGSTTKNRIAKSLAANEDWIPPAYSTDTIGTPCNDLSKNNRSGFSAFPSGSRSYNGKFMGGGRYAFWWSATAVDEMNAHNRWLLSYLTGLIFEQEGDKGSGFSIRLLKD